MHPLDVQRTTLTNGVRTRADGKGDPWAIEHRAELGNAFHMQDVDGFLGSFAFAKNTGDRLFLEYVPDSYQNRTKVIRRFAVVALFDRKKSDDTAFSDKNTLTTAFYLHLCRSLGSTQPKPPKFFFITGESSPWHLIEIDIETGETLSHHVLDKRCWRTLWEAAGLIHLRNELSQWLERD